MEKNYLKKSGMYIDVRAIEQGLQRTHVSDRKTALLETLLRKTKNRKKQAISSLLESITLK